MNTTMMAAVYYGPGKLRLEERPIPIPRADEVLLRVTRSGICGTDASEWKSGPLIFPVNKAHPTSGHFGPMVMGHEFVGEVVVVGSAVDALLVGDRVASGAGVSCGECPRCLEGRTNLCKRYVTLGLNRDGGMAEYVAVPATTLKKIPIGLPDDMAGLVQPLAVGIHAARRSGAKNGDTVVIIGAGAIGTFVLAGLNYLAEVSSILVDFDGPRLDRARRLGATHVVPVAENTEDELRKLVGESGADIVIEASGAPGQMQRALKWVRRGGTLLQVGLPSTPVEIDAHHAVMSEITIQTTLAHVCGEDVEPAFEILATSSLGQGLLEGVFGLDQLENQLNELASGKIQGKVLFDPRR